MSESFKYLIWIKMIVLCAVRGGLHLACGALGKNVSLFITLFNLLVNVNISAALLSG